MSVKYWSRKASPSVQLFGETVLNRFPRALLFTNYDAGYVKVLPPRQSKPIVYPISEIEAFPDKMCRDVIYDIQACVESRRRKS